MKKKREILKNKQVLAGVIMSFILVITFGLYTVYNQSSEPNKSRDIEEVKEDFTISEELEININENKQIEVNDADLQNTNFVVKNSKIASVDEKGVVTGLQSGETEVIVKVYGKEKICKIHIIEQEKNDDKNTEENKTTNNVTTNKNAHNNSQDSKAALDEKTKKSTTGGAAQPTKPTPTPESKPDIKPTPEPMPETNPKKEYTYYAPTAKSWIENNGGEYYQGTLYMREEHLDFVTSINFQVKFEEIKSDGEDYKVTIGGFLNYLQWHDDYTHKILENIFPDGVGPSLPDRFYNKYQSEFTHKGRAYKMNTSRFGVQIRVSGKEI